MCAGLYQQEFDWSVIIIFQLVLESHPYHVDALLTFSDVYKMHEDLKMARELVGKKFSQKRCDIMGMDLILVHFKARIKNSSFRWSLIFKYFRSCFLKGVILSKILVVV